MNKKLRATGLTVLALAIGLSATSCTAEDPPGSRPSASSTVSPSQSSNQSVEAEKVKKVVDEFFLAIDSDTQAFKAERASADPNEPKLTPEQQVEKIRDAYDASFAFIDFPSMGTQKSMDLIGWAARPLSNAPELSISVNLDGIKVDGDKATLDGEKFTIKANDAGDVTGPNYSPGTIELTRTGDKWLITEFVPNLPPTPTSTDPAAE